MRNPVLITDVEEIDLPLDMIPGVVAFSITGTVVDLGEPDYLPPGSEDLFT